MVDYIFIDLDSIEGLAEAIIESIKQKPEKFHKNCQPIVTANYHLQYVFVIPGRNNDYIAYQR